MKSISLLLAAIIFTVTSYSQFTLLSNNTNLETGFIVNGKALLIARNDSIWTTDGTVNGTHKLLDNVMFADSGGALHNSFFYFSGVTNSSGAELWKTDGTVSGTQLIKDIVSGTGSSGPSNFEVFNNKIFFTANNGLNGNELWVTDGTSAGTKMVKDINPGIASGVSLYPSFTLAGNFMYFIANDGIHGEEIWKTDGSVDGTSMIADLTPGLASTLFEWIPFPVLGDQVLFMSINKTDTSNTLWKTDGTTDGTTQLRNFVGDLHFRNSEYYKFNNRLYFSNRGWGKLWVTDGTTEGTNLIKELHSSLFNAITINDKFYFDGWSMTEPGELWVSDGTVAGTTVFNHVLEPDGMGFPDAYILHPFDYTNGNNPPASSQKFFYVVVGPSDCQLWIADPSSPGRTWKVTDLNDYMFGSFSHYYTSEGLYFTANKGAGTEPWLTDGTPSNTRSMADINPGAGSSNPFYLFIYNNKLFLNASNGDNADNTDLYVFTLKNSVVPVNLLEFSATRMTDAIHLQWLTAAEENMDHYQVERSTDGANFTSIGQEKAVASYNNSQTYSLDDKEALALNQPVIYYRLQMVENNGNFKYSNIVKVDLNNAGFSVTLSPNPVKNSANITIKGAHTGKLQVEIIDVSGRTLKQITRNINDGITQLPIDVSGLAPGSYLLRTINDNNQIVQQFIKQ